MHCDSATGTANAAGTKPAHTRIPPKKVAATRTTNCKAISATTHLVASSMSAATSESCAEREASRAGGLRQSRCAVASATTHRPMSPTDMLTEARDCTAVGVAGYSALSGSTLTETKSSLFGVSETKLRRSLRQPLRRRVVGWVLMRRGSSTKRRAAQDQDCARRGGSRQLACSSVTASQCCDDTSAHGVGITPIASSVS
mmetsp:Transcript_13446/g.33717  ORF Transcript_13446/g.33717 Transcript_13446/m.33717 type:complete len:200 (+) Transcript_13446:1278-1877(+)